MQIEFRNALCDPNGEGIIDQDCAAAFDDTVDEINATRGVPFCSGKSQYVCNQLASSISGTACCVLPARSVRCRCPQHPQTADVLDAAVRCRYGYTCPIGCRLGYGPKLVDIECQANQLGDGLWAGQISCKPLVCPLIPDNLVPGGFSTFGSSLVVVDIGLNASGNRLGRMLNASMIESENLTVVGNDFSGQQPVTGRARRADEWTLDDLEAEADGCYMALFFDDCASGKEALRPRAAWGRDSRQCVFPLPAC